MSIPELLPTPGQTVGSFFGYALPFANDSDLVPRSHPDAIRLHGRVIDGGGEGVPDALAEIWRADPMARLRSNRVHCDAMVTHSPAGADLQQIPMDITASPLCYRVAPMTERCRCSRYAYLRAACLTVFLLEHIYRTRSPVIHRWLRSTTTGGRL